MWEPKRPGVMPVRASFPEDGKSARILDVNASQRGSHFGGSARHKHIPAELLVLNRFGIGYPYIKAAWKMSLLYGLDGREILVRAGIITRDVWRRSEAILLEERRVRLRESLFKDKLLDQAINSLHRRAPHYSAHYSFELWQIAVIVLVFLGALTAIRLELDGILLFLLMAVSTFYTGVVVLRAQLLGWYDRRIRSAGNNLPVLDTNLPDYSILVPLYRESSQVIDLVTHLSRLNWPSAKLDIKLICERDDRETVAAINGIQLPPSFELVLVPPANPRTKPKALNYALPLCRGEFVVIYDAEDRPAFNQLREAFASFSACDPKIACLQAPLLVSNENQSWLSNLFSMEYLTLFKGILPVLAKWEVPIPLGGTSNHFSGVR